MDSMDQFPPLLRLGQSLFASNRFKEADETFSSCLQLDHVGDDMQRLLRQLEAYKARGRCRLFFDQSLAIDDFKIVVQLQEELASRYPSQIRANEHSEVLLDNAHFNLGACYKEMGRFEEALNEFNMAIHSGPHSDCRNHYCTNAYALRAVCHQILGNDQLAINDVTLAESWAPDLLDWSNYFTRGYCHHQLKNYAAAITDYSKSLQMSPNETCTISRRGTCYLKTGQYEKALSDFERTARIDPEEAEMLTLMRPRGEALESLKRYEEAIEQFTICHDRNPEDPFALLHRGQCYAALGCNLSDADFFRALGLAQLHNESDDFIEAIGWNDDPDPDVTMTRFGATIRLANLARDLSPTYLDDETRMIDYASFLSKCGREIEALYWFNEAVERFPTSAKVLFDRAQFHYTHNRLAQSRSDLERSRLIDPTFDQQRIRVVDDDRLRDLRRVVRYRTCYECGRLVERKSRACSRCRVARYCSRKCQIRAWKKHHSGQCPRLAQLKEEDQESTDN